MIKSGEISDLIVNYILNLSEVVKAKEQIDSIKNGYINFNIDLTDQLKQSIFENFGIKLDNISSIPMRWIKGDTQPHIDRSINNFHNTYLAYLTNNPGKLIIDGDSYPISKGKTYIFSEGLSHETIDTGFEPRLLLGPMSEMGISVGLSFNYPGGTTVYMRQISGIIQYSTDQSNWSAIGNNFPIFVTNINTSLGVVTIEFITDITLDDSSPGGINKYFVCQTSDIQFGSNTLNVNGNIPIITIDGIIDYPGLIKNGGFDFNLPPGLIDGFSNITIQNIGIITTNGSTLSNPGGWLCQGYFGRNGSNNIITNCYSTGPINGGSGGIIGIHAASRGGSLSIDKCFSTGFIDNEAGGIVGNNAANNGGTITITNCYSFGEIGGSPSLNGSGGGIVGSFAEQVNISNCYSLGAITGDGCGGIIGTNYANNLSVVTIQNCYSIGDISGTGSGGIAGLISDGTATIQNCYTSGLVVPGNYGIAPAGANITNCYSEGDNSSSGWNDIRAIQYLSGINTIWASIYPNTNYLLKIFNQTLYSQTPYIRSGDEIFTTNLGLIQNTNPDFKYYLINQPSGVTYNSTTGAITFGSNIEPGTYTINVVCGIDPPGQFYNYNINSFIFTQGITPNVPICFPAGTPVLTDQGEIPIDKINKKIHTIDGKEIITITESIPLDSYLICIERNSLGNNIPNRRTIISKDHKVLCDKKMVRAEYLIQYIPTIYRVIYNKERLYNIVLKEHSTMSVNNLIVETMNPNHILAKIYSGNYTPQEKNKLILMLNNYHVKQRSKLFIKKNILTG